MTETEKNTVVKFVKDLLFNNLNTKFTNAEIRERIQKELGYSIAPATLGSIITRRIADNTSSPYLFIKETGKYMVATEKVYKLIKEKSQVFLCDEEGNLELIWDYNNSNFRSEGVNNGFYDKVKIDDKKYKAYNVTDKIPYLPEWVFSYPNVLKNIFSLSIFRLDRLPKKLNKSDIELTNFFCPLNDYTNGTWADTLIFIHKFTDNNNSVIFKGLNKIAFNLLLSLENEWSRLGIKEAINLLNLTRKLAICSVKNFEEFDGYGDIFSGLIKMEKLGWLPYLDTNRTFNQNYKIFEEYRDKARNNMLSKYLKKLNFLNNYQIEDYIICVPQDKNDLIEEGKAQNNCVGHYYNDSIIEGENLIYFIRHKENPTKSFVTCRYNLSDKTTVEHRIKNNKWYENADLLNAIDKLINENI